MHADTLQRPQRKASKVTKTQGCRKQKKQTPERPQVRAQIRAGVGGNPYCFQTQAEVMTVFRGIPKQYMYIWGMG